MRTPSGLVETTEEELNSLAKKMEQPLPPTNPAAAASIGASPDAAKMAGSRQQKAAVHDKAVDPTKRLDTVQRREAPQPKQAAPVSQSPAQITAIQKLRGIDSVAPQIQAIVQKKLAAQTASTQLNTARLDAGEYSSANPRADLEALLNQYVQLSSNPETPPTEINKVLADLQTKYGISDPKGYVNLDQSSIADQAKGVQIKAGELDIPNAEALDTLLPANWRDMSVDDFQIAVEDARQQHFNRVGALKAQMVAATNPAIRQQLMEELEALGESGVTGQEAEAKSITSQLRESATISIGGREFTVQELMSDELVSDLIRDYLSPTASPKFKEELAKEHPEFVAWINSNADELKGLADRMGVQQTDFRDLQVQVDEALRETGLNEDALKRLYGTGTDGVVTEAMDVAANSIYEALQDKDTGAALLSAINASPALVDVFKTMPAEKIKSVTAANTSYATNSAAQHMLGRVPEFETDVEDLDQMLDAVDVANSLTAVGVNPQDPDAVALFRSGELTPAIAKALTSDEWTAFKEYRDTERLLDSADTIEELLGMLTSESLSELNAQYATIAKQAKWSQSARQALEDIHQTYDINEDGVIDQKDATGIKKSLQENLGSASLEDFAAGKAKLDRASQSIGSLSERLDRDVAAALSYDANLDQNFSSDELISMATSNPRLLNYLESQGSVRPNTAKAATEAGRLGIYGGNISEPLKRKLFTALEKDGEITSAAVYGLTLDELQEYGNLNAPGFTPEGFQALYNRKADEMINREMAAFGMTPDRMDNLMLALELGRTLNPEQTNDINQLLSRIQAVGNPRFQERVAGLRTRIETIATYNKIRSMGLTGKQMEAYEAHRNAGHQLNPQHTALLEKAYNMIKGNPNFRGFANDILKLIQHRF